MDETDAQLKELYDEIDEQDRQEREELARLREERNLIGRLLDRYGIPERNGGSLMSVLERVDLALRKRICA